MACLGVFQIPSMKTCSFIALTSLTLVLCGCTSLALRHSTANQAKTLSDLLADQVLYNLALYKDYYEGNRVNGLPSFVKLASGQSQVQQSINGQVGIKIPPNSGTEVDPQISGGHQTSDNWGFTPVIDPNEMNRLFCLYRAEFKEIGTNELSAIFPSPAPPLDQQGRPFLDYHPVTVTNDNQISVLITNNQPVFTATLKASPPPPQLNSIPGAIIDEKGDRNAGWFSFTQPENSTTATRMGPYLSHYIWITNRDSFFKFALLALGQTNVTTGPLLQIQNGLLLRLQ